MSYAWSTAETRDALNTNNVMIVWSCTYITGLYTVFARGIQTTLYTDCFILLLCSLALYSENICSPFLIAFSLQNFRDLLLMYFALCYVIINCFMSINLFVVCLFPCFVCFVSIVCVLCLCIVSPHVYSCLFSICVLFYPHCHRGETQL